MMHGNSVMGLRNRFEHDRHNRADGVVHRQSLIKDRLSIRSPGICDHFRVCLGPLGSVKSSWPTRGVQDEMASLSAARTYFV
jgi:hypothetical protein